MLGPLAAAGVTTIPFLDKEAAAVAMHEVVALSFYGKAPRFELWDGGGLAPEGLIRAGPFPPPLAAEVKAHAESAGEDEQPGELCDLNQE